MIPDQEQERGSQISFYIYGTRVFLYGKCKQPLKLIFGFKILSKPIKKSKLTCKSAMQLKPTLNTPKKRVCMKYLQHLPPH